MRTPQFFECPKCGGKIKGKINLRNHCPFCNQYFYFWTIKKLYRAREGETFMIDRVQIKGQLCCGEETFVIYSNKKKEK